MKVLTYKGDFSSLVKYGYKVHTHNLAIRVIFDSLDSILDNPTSFFEDLENDNTYDNEYTYTESILAYKTKDDKILFVYEKEDFNADSIRRSTNEKDVSFYVSDIQKDNLIEVVDSSEIDGLDKLAFNGFFDPRYK